MFLLEHLQSQMPWNQYKSSLKSRFTHVCAICRSSKEGAFCRGLYICCLLKITARHKMKTFSRIMTSAASYPTNFMVVPYLSQVFVCIKHRDSHSVICYKPVTWPFWLYLLKFDQILTNLIKSDQIWSEILRFYFRLFLIYT